MANGQASLDHIAWGLGGLCAGAEGPIAVAPHGGHWLYALSGDIVTADGNEALDFDIVLCDGNGFEWAEGHTLGKTDVAGLVNSVASVNDIVIPTPIESIKPTQPDNPSTGDIFTVCVAVASLSAAGLAISKKRR